MQTKTTPTYHNIPVKTKVILDINERKEQEDCIITTFHRIIV